jgi:hypothetical protein
MPEVIDSFSFDKGVNTRKSSTALSDGELQECSGFTLDNDGYLKPMKPRVKMASDAYGEIKNLHRYLNTVLMCEGANVRYAWDLRGYCDNYTAPDNNFTLAGVGYDVRHRIVDYQGWMFMVNGHTNKAFSKDALYDWSVANPQAACVGTAGAAGNPNGTYNLYYTYVVKFPNGMQYETGPSPPASVTVASQKITWSGITPCPYGASGVEITKRLYRYSSGLAETYYVTEIANATLTYSDDAKDATIQTNDTLATESFDVPPEGLTDIDLYIYRMFGVKGTYLYWSEPYIPFGFLTTSSINVTDGDDLVAVRFWGDQLYIASKGKWYRLSGTDPDTWGIKNTFADAGVINPHTVKATKYGILGLGYDGIYMFDGSISKSITEKKLGTSLFLDDISDTDTCYAEWDGVKYYFYYPESSTTLSKCLVIDFTFYPELRVYNDPFIASALQYHKPTGRRYMARLDAT